MDARADHQMASGRRQLGIVAAQCSGGSQPSSTDGFQSSPTVGEPSTHGPSSGWANLAWARLRRIP